jgi:hypothetical protein
LLKRQFYRTQIALGFDQHQRAFVGNHQRWALTRHVHRLGFSSDGGFGFGDLGGVGVDPLQAGSLGDLNQVLQRQVVRLDLGQAGSLRRSGWRRCGSRRWRCDWCRCGNGDWRHIGRGRGRGRGCNRGGNGYVCYKFRSGMCMLFLGLWPIWL